MTEASLENHVRDLDLESGKAMLVSMANDQTAMTTVMLQHGGSTWFFKLMGAKPAVEKEVDRLIEFVKSVRFH